jgi:mannose-6-phosphate isomerase-like protein (cupin superfamily)
MGAAAPPMAPVRGSEHRTEPTPEDCALLVSTMQQEDLELLSETFKANADQYLEEFVPKPWGHEYRVYADSFFDIWKLRMAPSQSTSMHCHPRKDTTLLCLRGEGVFHLLGHSRPIGAMDVVHIRKGVFHATESVGTVPLDLIEVEAPRNKLDLVRAADRYGRRGAEYEKDNLQDCDPLRDGCLTHRSRVRGASFMKEYVFDVRAGMDLLCRPDPRLIFAVSLDIMSTLMGTIVVHQSPTSDEIDQLGLYWTISRAA